MRKTNLKVPAGSVADPRVPVPLLGASEGAARTRDGVERAALARTPVLIVAEPGLRPKEVVAWMHARGRAPHPLVTLDCGSSEPSDLDVRLFGQPVRTPMPSDLEVLEADAALVTAKAGTVFLEHVEELPASAQRRLARILRDGEVRLSATREPMTIACRIVASTTRDLEAEVREGRFRQDLFRRIAASRITVPPLRQRPSDLVAMIEQLLAEANVVGRSFTQPAATVLAALPWAENVDELSAVLARITANAGAVIRQEDVLAHLPIEGAFARLDLTESLRDARRRFERDYIAAVLERHHWRMSEAAKALGIERANLYRKTRQLGIHRANREELTR